MLWLSSAWRTASASLILKTLTKVCSNLENYPRSYAREVCLSFAFYWKSKTITRKEMAYWPLTVWYCYWHLLKLLWQYGALCCVVWLCVDVVRGNQWTTMHQWYMEWHMVSLRQQSIQQLLMQLNLLVSNSAFSILMKQQQQFQVIDIENIEC